MLAGVLNLTHQGLSLSVLEFRMSLGMRHIFLHLHAAGFLHFPLIQLMFSTARDPAGHSTDAPDPTEMPLGAWRFAVAGDLPEASMLTVSVRCKFISGSQPGSSDRDVQ